MKESQSKWGQIDDLKTQVDILKQNFANNVRGNENVLEGKTATSTVDISSDQVTKDFYKQQAKLIELDEQLAVYQQENTQLQQKHKTMV